MLEHHLVVQGLRQWPPSTYSRMCAEDTAGHDHAVDSKVPQRLPDAQRFLKIPITHTTFLPMGSTTPATVRVAV